ncbi:hypothetical protein SK128_004059 [Halocaridina rubra]|uniref:Uncharacterized protein n=1 Tax=Halocaridina rubra TaxID=373956 RepID=A0AAN9A4Z1_HALRR
MGSNRIRKLATFEAWILVAHTPTHDFVPLEHYYPAYESPPSIHEKKTKGRVWAEVITIRRRYEIVYASPTHITALVPKLPDFRCSWHDDPAMAEQKIFCEKYEGYTRLCTCEDPITSAYRFHSVSTIFAKA